MAFLVLAQVFPKNPVLDEAMGKPFIEMGHDEFDIVKKSQDLSGL
jgi:hypothetical protein